MAHASESCNSTPLRQPREPSLTSFQIADLIFRYDERHSQRCIQHKPHATAETNQFQAEKRVPVQQLTFYLHKRRKLQSFTFRQNPTPARLYVSRTVDNSPSPPMHRTSSPSQRRSPLPPVPPSHTRSKSMAGRTSRLNRLIAICDSLPTARPEHSTLNRYKEDMARWREVQKLHEKMRPYTPDVLVPLYFEHMQSEQIYKGEAAAIIREVGKGASHVHASTKKPSKRS